MINYRKKVFCLLQEFSYLIFSVRRKGLIATAETVVLDDFEPVVKPIVAYGLQLLKSGIIPEHFRMFLELKKIDYWKNIDMTVEDLKLIQLSIESLLYVQLSDIAEYRSFTYTVFELEGSLEDRLLFSQILNTFQKAEEEKRDISKQELKEYIRKISINPVKPRLSKKEIDQIMSENFDLDV